MVVSLYFFFFSSRRRHTRSYGDWSSDVCSSDLIVHIPLRWRHKRRVPFERLKKGDDVDDLLGRQYSGRSPRGHARVGKEHAGIPDELEEISIRQTPIADDRQIWPDASGRPNVVSRNQVAAGAGRLGPRHEQLPPPPRFALEAGQRNSSRLGKGPRIVVGIGGPPLVVGGEGREGLLVVTDLNSSAADLLDLAPGLGDRPSRPPWRGRRLVFFRSRDTTEQEEGG